MPRPPADPAPHGHPASYWSYLKRAVQMAVAAHREGRLTASPRRWFVDLRHLHGVMRAPADKGAESASIPPTPVRAAAADPDAAKAALREECAAALRGFLGSGERLVLPRAGQPVVSVVIVLFNGAELTLRCLRSLSAETIPLEVVLVDNGSTDETGALLDRVDGATLSKSGVNLGYLRGCNAGAASARGTHLLLLNSDTALTPGSLEAAVETLESDARIGAVGARLTLTDGRLQEAGSIVWRDGSCIGYGRGEEPESPAYAFMRDVDFCSAAFLLTRRALFERLGGFDPAYEPAYYEDVDYCVRLWQAGHRVVYDPRVIVRHFEFGSAATAADSLARQARQQAVFVARHDEWLMCQPLPTPLRTLAARSRPPAAGRILVFDDRVPHTRFGSGLPRALELVRSLVALGWEVTLYPLWIVDEPWSSVYLELPRSVEVMIGLGTAGVRGFLDERAGFYDAVIVSRSHNIDRLRSALGPPQRWCPGTPVIYDAEAVQSVREGLRRRLSGQSDDDLEAAVAQELQDVAEMDAVMTVSPLEQRRLAGAGRPVHVVRHSVRPSPGATPFESRRGFVFVGAFGPQSPNADSVLWFEREVRPIVEARIGPVEFTIVGHAPPEEVLALESARVRVLADVPDLGPIYDQARVAIAPTRFAAGIPLKVLHAAGHGVPVVSTRLLAAQLDWQDGHELLAADDAADFAAACVSAHSEQARWMSLREAALTRIRREYAPDAFTEALSRCLAATVGVRSRHEVAS